MVFYYILLYLYKNIINVWYFWNYKLYKKSRYI